VSAEISIDSNVTFPADSLLRLQQVMAITSLCRSHVFLLIKQGKFPTSITVGVRGARWVESEVRQWVSNQIATARKASAVEATEAGAA
jgi:prophage regulatory protein